MTPSPRLIKLSSQCDVLKSRIARKAKRHEATGEDLAKLRAVRLKQLKAEIRLEKAS